MKKYITIFALTLLVLTLSACDLLESDIVQEVTEDFCLENPENELCNIDSLDDIEESVVQALFVNMLENIDTMDIDQYCTQFISKENPELLESCKKDVMSIFPEGIEDFEVLSVLKENDQYKIELHNMLNDDMISFMLAIEMLDSNLLVSSLTYGDIYTMPLRDEEVLLKAIDHFIKDMENENLSDDQICALYEGIDNDCDGLVEARTKFKAGADLSKKINLIDEDDDGDGILTGEIAYTFDGHVTLIKVSFEVDHSETDFTVVFTSVSIEDDSMNDESFTLEEVKFFWDKFIMDYLNPDISSEDINSMYFLGMLAYGFTENRIKDLESNVLMSTISIDYSNSVPDSYFDVALEISYGESISDSILKIKVSKKDDSLYMSFVTPSIVEDISYEEAIMVLDTYKKGYNHYASLSNTFCESTLIDFQTEECIIERDKMMDQGYVLVDYSLDLVDSNYMVDFIYEDADMNQMIVSKIVMFYLSEDLYLLAFYDLTTVDIPNQEVDMFLENFVKGAGDTSTLTTNVCHFLSSGSDGEDNDCDGIVTTVRDGGYDLTIAEKEDNGNMYFIELMFTNDTSSYSEYYYFTFFYDEDMLLNALLTKLDPSLFIYSDIYEIIGLINEFDLSVDLACNTNLHEDSYDTCVAIRNFHESNDYSLMIVDINIDEDEIATVYTVTYDSKGIEVERNVFTMYYIKNAQGTNPIFIGSGMQGNNPLYE